MNRCALTPLWPIFVCVVLTRVFTLQQVLKLSEKYCDFFSIIADLANTGNWMIKENYNNSSIF